jgi:predicted O-methyltransferase YrrM
MDNGRESTTSRERHHQQVRDVRQRLAHDGPPWTRDRADDFAVVTLPERDCDALRDLLIAEGVETIVEVGLAYGSSALAIGEALVSGGARRPLHVIIDPLQATEWSNVGWQLLRSASLDAIARLVLQPSSMALPQLVAEPFTADAAFVDGSHRFHEVFVDLYFLRKIVRPGGIIVLDDHWWPSVRTAEHYFEVNMGVAGRRRGLRRWHDRPGDRTQPRPGSAPARPCIRAGIRALPAVLMGKRPPGETSSAGTPRRLRSARSGSAASRRRSAAAGERQQPQQPRCSSSVIDRSRSVV